MNQKGKIIGHLYLTTPRVFVKAELRQNSSFLTIFNKAIMKGVIIIKLRTQN